MLTINKHRFMIEKYQSVLFLSETLILIQLKDYQIQIHGENLILDYYSNIEIRGHGQISQVRFIY